MANNSTQFSEMLVLESEAEIEWVREFLQEYPYDEGVSEAEERKWCKVRGIEPGIGDEECWPGFGYQIDADGKDLWIHSEDSGNIENVVNFITRYLQKFHQDKCWSMSWADTCDRPRVGEFGGGAVFVTAKRVSWVNTYSWMHRQREQWLKKSMSKKEVKK